MPLSALLFADILYEAGLPPEMLSVVTGDPREIADEMLTHPAVDLITFTGPYGDAFVIPEDPETNLLMIGTGTGIAPFRAFIQHIYEKQPNWRGKVRLFYGARTGTETLYRNDLKDDLTNYYSRETFEAFEGLSKRPWISLPSSVRVRTLPRWP